MIGDPCRRDLIFILGDQLSPNQASLCASRPQHARVVMAEVRQESLEPASTKTRTVLFLSAMRHFAQTLRSAGWEVEYLMLGQHPHEDLGSAWTAAIRRHRPARVLCTAPGDWRILKLLETTCAQQGVALECLEDQHFLISRKEFADWAGQTRSLQMERFYRFMRSRHNVLMTSGAPIGGQWNYDAENRASFGKAGPGAIPERPGFPADEITRSVIQDVERCLPHLAGEVSDFNWPVTRAQARHVLEDFVSCRLARFGPTQDAMWTDEPYLWHSLLSAALNLKLLDPGEVIEAATQAYERGEASLPSVEGFIRQILGWREFMRGVYWLDMPGMRASNHFSHQQPLPSWFWTGNTGMHCLRSSIRQTLKLGYAHHIQRLMVIGNFALIAGLNPQAVEDWFLAVYVDAVEWVELPNVAGMALYANGGRFTSKPYCASGAYIKRMSNYCSSCRYDPGQRTGPRACPVTTFYWDFLIRNEAEMSNNPRAVLMMKHVAKIDDIARTEILRQASLNRTSMESL